MQAVPRTFDNDKDIDIAFSTVSVAYVSAKSVTVKSNSVGVLICDVNHDTAYLMCRAARDTCDQGWKQCGAADSQMVSFAGSSSDKQTLECIAWLSSFFIVGSSVEVME